MGIAIATVEGRVEVQRLVEEQAALRRVATLVARGVEPAEIFSAVIDEVEGLFGPGTAAVLRFEHDGPAFVIVGLSPSMQPVIPVGARWELEEGMSATEVYRTGRSARVENWDWSLFRGPIRTAGARLGFVSTVASPIVVEGRLWGAMNVNGKESLPPDTEQRLEKFTELVATAIANAENKAELAMSEARSRRLAGEQAALRRVATLVAQGVAPADVFSAVTKEVARVFSTVEAPLVATVIRFDPGPQCVLVGASRAYEREPVGSRWDPKDLYVSTRVLRTGRSARVDEADLETGGGPDADVLRLRGFFYQVGSPVVVEGRLWGAMTLNSSEELPPDTDESLENFTELIATAIANAESRGARARLADEQAALQRVATLVAQGAARRAIFAAVSVEVDRLFRLDPQTADVAGVVRFDPGPEMVVVGVSKTLDVIQLGSHWPLEDLFAPTRVLRSGRPARVDESDLLSVGGPVAEFLLSERYLTQVAGPIVVEGQLWGAVSVNSRESLPPDTEERLEKFTRLIATAISNAEARDSLRRLADEQAALRRVATLVAEGTAPTDLFAAVAVEVAAVVGVSSVSVSRFLPDGCSVVLASHNDPGFPVGSRWRPDEGTINAAILEAARPARVDQKVLSGPVAEASRISDVRSAVAAPIVVEGGVWGMVAVGRQHSDEPLPPQAETRLAAFTELIATAIANAESRDELTLLAAEQAALRRVATLVARDAPSTEVFEAVATEVGTLLDTDITIVGRYDGDGAATAIGNWSASPGGVPVGTRSALGGRNVLTMVAETGRPARMDGYSDASGEAAEIARRHGWRSSIAAPIAVGDRLWGVMLVATQRPEVFPAGAEERLEKFTELVATAIANAESRAEGGRLANQEAALRRVATLVAEGAAPADVFTAVAWEVGRLFDFAAVTLNRYEEDAVVVVADPLDSGFPVGSRWPFDGDSLSVRVRTTGRMARIDDYSDIDSSAAARMRERASRSAIGVPIFVEGDLWGLLCVGAAATELLPTDTEARIAGFVELVGTAIANSQARDGLRLLADEQTALRRVATLVAKGAAPDDVFTAVAWEVAQLFDFAAVTLNRYEDDAVVVVADPRDSGFPVGSRWPFDGDSLSVRVRATGRVARIDDYSDIDGTTAARMRELDSRSAIGVPIVVEGSLWGILCVGAAAAELLSADTEARIAGFVELVGTAIANSQARDGLRLLADEQTALRRVATLVARDAPSTEVFEAVATEVGTLLDTDITIVGRFDDDGAATAIGNWSASPGGVPVGTRSKLGGRNVLTIVAETGKPARMDEYGDASGEAAEIARRHGWRSSIAAPIAVEGRLWGVMLVATQRPEPFPAGAEERLEKFTELVATAIANAESRSAREQLADEQAALRRIATLVARGVPSEEVLAAVTEETAATFRAITCVERFEHDPPGIALAGVSGETDLTVGTRWEHAEALASAEVYRTGRSARLGAGYDWSSRGGPVAEEVRRLGIVAQVSCPIIVEGSLWGVITLNAREELPPDTEQRLEKFTELVTTAIANAESKSELAASRRRIVAASDDTRRRIERDLHDGTQQRLVSLGLAVRAAEASLPPERDDLRAELSDVAMGLAAVVEDLQEISRGIHPAILSKGGLGPALQTLAHRSAIPVDLDVTTEVRFAEPIEVAAYFVASEALANAAKHSQATRIDVVLEQRDRTLVLAVRDDGVGGADPSGGGSGLVGLRDRVEALGGSISVDSPQGDGTRITVELPVEPEAPQPA